MALLEHEGYSRVEIPPEEEEDDWDGDSAWDHAATERGVQIAEVYEHLNRSRRVFLFPNELIRCGRNPMFVTLVRLIFDQDRIPSNSQIRQLCAKLRDAQHRRSRGR